MFDSDFLIMKEAGVSFTSGLTENELSMIHHIYGITFPAKVRHFMMNALPISNGFYNWKDTSVSNIEYIKHSITAPALNLLEDYKSISWNPNWGANLTGSEFVSFLRRKLASSAILIPFYSHRYIPMIDIDDPPVLSISGADVIIYAQTFSEYIPIEFGGRRPRPISLLRIPNIPFWSDLL